MLNRDFAGTTAGVGKSFTQPAAIRKNVDLSDALANYQKGMDKRLSDQQRDALVTALQGGDETEINNAAAAYDPAAFYNNMMKVKEANAQFDRQKELANYNNGLDLEKQKKLYELKERIEAIKDGTTAAQRNVAFLQRMGYSPESAIGLAFSGQNPALDVMSLGKKGFESYDKETGKNIAEREKAAQDATDEYNSVNSNINRILELLPQAGIETFIDRKTPTLFFNDKAQEARGELRNLLGGMRLDQMKYMKGAISDKEQEFLSDVVSGDFSKYTPAEIRGTMNSILRKASAVRDNYSSQVDSDPLGLR